jgi:Straboviridae/Kyanoviridae head completion nuclease
MAYKGKYKVKDPKKYLGDASKVIYRSLWERTCMVYFDTNKDVIAWNSECVKIPYISPVDEKRHTYYVDFFVKFKKKELIKQVLIEVKPKKQTKPPPEPKRRSSRYYRAIKLYMVNKAKWDAAAKFCHDTGMEFLIWTEDTLKGIA